MSGYTIESDTKVVGGVSESVDHKTKDFGIGIVHGQPGNSISANAFANGMKESGAYKAVGGSLAVEKSGFGAGVNAVHTHAGDQVRASGQMTILNNDHQLGVNAFTTKTMPKGGPSFETHGGGVDYKFRDNFGANASMAHTPKFNHTNYDVGATMNLHQTPSSAMNLNVGASKTISPQNRGNWEPKMFFSVRKDF